MIEEEIGNDNIGHKLSLELKASRILQNTTLRYGNLMVFRRNEFGQHRIVIGPHWYISMVGFTILLVGGLSILIPLWPVLSLLVRILFISIFSFTLMIYFLMFISNPGIIPEKIIRDENEDIEDKSKYSCLRCLALKIQKAHHCEDCDVCISNYDHHCVWVGKCIGGRNLVLFYVFIASIPVLFVFLMVVSSMMSFELDKLMRHQ